MMDLGKLNRYRSWLLSAGIILLVAIWLLSGQLGNDDAALSSETQTERRTQHTQVRVRTQIAEDVVRTIVVNGKTAPARIVQLAAETDGRITDIGAERGNNVDRNGVIVRLDERDRRARLAQAAAMVKQREVEYEARARLQQKSYVSEAQLQEAVASLEAARAELKRAQLDLGYMTVRAPFDGALQARAVEVGDFVGVGDPIATFVDNRRIIVSADVSEFDAIYVQKGAPAEAKLATGERVRGTIRYVAPVADEATRTFNVELEVDNADGTLRTGGTAELYIPAETVTAHRISPALLTLDDAGNVGLKIVDDNDRVRFIVADIALATDQGVWVTGLPKTATIITVGQGFVNPGSLVDAVAEADTDTAVAKQSDSEAD